MNLILGDFWWVWVIRLVIKDLIEWERIYWDGVPWRSSKVTCCLSYCWNFSSQDDKSKVLLQKFLPGILLIELSKKPHPSLPSNPTSRLHRVFPYKAKTQNAWRLNFSQINLEGLPQNAFFMCDDFGNHRMN